MQGLGQTKGPWSLDLVDRGSSALSCTCYTDPVCLGDVVLCPYPIVTSGLGSTVPWPSPSGTVSFSLLVPPLNASSLAQCMPLPSTLCSSVSCFLLPSPLLENSCWFYCVAIGNSDSCPSHMTFLGPSMVVGFQQVAEDSAGQRDL